MGMFNNLKEGIKDKAGQAMANYYDNAPAREAKKAEKKAAKERKKNFIGWATSSHFPIGTKVYLAENEEEKILELEHPNGDVYFLKNSEIIKAYPPVLGVIDIKDHIIGSAMGTAPDQTIIYGAKYLVETADSIRVMLSIILGEPMYKVERVIY